jgi:hypothetical protein
LLLSAVIWQPAPTSAAETPAPATTEERVGEWSDLTRLEFSGLQTFSATQVRRALGRHMPFLAASHPLAARRDLLPAIEKWVRTGFLAQGFPDVRVSARSEPAAKRLRVEVTEGPRYRCGDVRINGAHSVPVSEITRRLTQPWPADTTAVPDFSGGQTAAQAAVYLNSAGQEVRREDAAWPREQPANFSPAGRSFLRQRAGQVLADCGYFLPLFEVRLAPQPGTGKADLQIEILNEGPHSRIGRIEVHGLKRNTPEQVLQWLGLRSGQDIAPDLVARIEQRLWQSGRFTRYRVAPAAAPDAGNQIQLDLWLTEAEQAPPLGTEFSPEARAMLKFRDWLEAQLSFASPQTDDLVVRLPKIEALPVDFGAVELILSRRGLLVTLRRDGALRTALLLTQDRRLFYSAEQQRKLVSAKPGGGLNVFLTMLPMQDENANERTNLTFGANWTSVVAAGAPFKVDALLAPVCFAENINASDPPTIENGRLLLAFGDRILEIDSATGRILGVRGSKAAAKDDFDIQVTTGAFDRVEQEVDRVSKSAPNLLAAQGAASALLPVVGRELLAGGYLGKWLQKTLTPTQQADAAAAFEKLCAHRPLTALDRWLDDDTSADNAFTIPEDDQPDKKPDNQIAALLAVLAQGIESFLPEQSWPRQLLRELVFAGSGQTAYLEATVQELARSPETGPLAIWAGARLLGLVDSPAAAAMARQGLERLQAADFQRDCRLLFDDRSGLGHALQAVANGLRALSEKETESLAALLDDDAAGILRRGAQALRARPKEPLSAVLQPTFDEMWERHWRARVETGLRTAIGAAVDAAERERIFNEAARLMQKPAASAAEKAEGVKLMQQAAELGERRAEFVMAQLHAQGNGVARDPAVSLEWMRRAAGHGIIEAQMNLGTAYQLGFDVPADPVEAAFWYGLAAAGGHKPAESLLAVVRRKLTPAQLDEAERRLKAAVTPPVPAPQAAAAPKRD